MKLSSILVAGLLVCAYSVSTSGQDDWPRVGYAWPAWKMLSTPDGRRIVDIPSLIGEQMEWVQHFPNAVSLRLSIEQARAIAQVFHEMGEDLRQSIMEREAIEATGDPDLIARARERQIFLSQASAVLFPDMVKERLAETLTADQLDTLKALCVNSLLQHYSFDDILVRGFELSNLKPDDQKIIELRMAVIEAEFELGKEMAQLQKRAWDKIMGKLPKEVVQAIEADFGFDGLSVKTK
ncbi:MAG TPA: hypothetical protein PKD54_10070 [Pirellulaceae bacterium]|nr:hypothetical protein [Pirellulaceae bacterium]